MLREKKIIQQICSQSINQQVNKIMKMWNIKELGMTTGEIMWVNDQWI